MAFAALKGGQPFKWAVISAGKMAADFTAAIRQLPGHEGEAAVPPPCHVPAECHCRRAVPCAWPLSSALRWPAPLPMACSPFPGALPPRYALHAKAADLTKGPAHHL